MWGSGFESPMGVRGAVSSWTVKNSTWWMGKTPSWHQKMRWDFVAVGGSAQLDINIQRFLLLPSEVVWKGRKGDEKEGCSRSRISCLYYWPYIIKPRSLVISWEFSIQRLERHTVFVDYDKIYRYPISKEQLEKHYRLDFCVYIRYWYYKHWNWF